MIVLDQNRTPNISCQGSQLFLNQGGFARRRLVGFGCCCEDWSCGQIGWRFAWLEVSGSGTRCCCSWTAVGCLLHNLTYAPLQLHHLTYASLQGLTYASLQARVRETSKGRVHLLQAALGKLTKHLTVIFVKKKGPGPARWHLHLTSRDSAGPHEVVSTWIWFLNLIHTLGSEHLSPILSSRLLMGRAPIPNWRWLLSFLFTVASFINLCPSSWRKVSWESTTDNCWPRCLSNQFLNNI